MNFIEIAKKRYSVRNYSSKKVEKEKLDKILQATRVAIKHEGKNVVRIAKKSGGMEKILPQFTYIVWQKTEMVIFG